ncbi:ankyrin repeat-containing domain protein [Polychytrium aggregatum]|uniref:ankyrin repeat-containing domain protein n=1 Tax=Polychytrium aggregatum TaxID=110093 RepID=UPI0022FEBA0D|nr:ankyrin repeat-containing domain protein [Polychytrium aggregatum]KAI9193547.1 ankyrin repeat-containing domain protein [Polychytrium aggregatum]
MAATAELSDFDHEEFVTCARYGELDELQQLVSAYLDQHPTDPDHLPALKRSLFTVKNASGHTALHMAAANGQHDILAFLLPSLTRDDVNITNNEGSSALHWASVNGKLDCVELLLKFGADATLKNHAGKSSITVASQQDHLDVATALLKSFDPEDDDEDKEVDAGDEDFPEDETDFVIRAGETDDAN